MNNWDDYIWKIKNVPNHQPEMYPRLAPKNSPMRPDVAWNWASRALWKQLRRPWEVETSRWRSQRWPSIQVTSLESPRKNDLRLPSFTYCKRSWLEIRCLGGKSKTSWTFAWNRENRFFGHFCRLLESVALALLDVFVLDVLAHQSNCAWCHPSTKSRNCTDFYNIKRKIPTFWSTYSLPIRHYIYRYYIYSLSKTGIPMDTPTSLKNLPGKNRWCTGSGTGKSGKWQSPPRPWKSENSEIWRVTPMGR